VKRFINTYCFKILTGLCILYGTNLYAQDTSITVKYDTVKVLKRKYIRIISIRTPPKFILQVNGSFSFGAMELQGHNGGFSFDDIIKGKTYGARNGYGANLTGKISLHKKAHFWLDFTAGFTRFQSDLIADNTKDGKVAYNVFSGGTGLDYIFTPADKVKYFIGLNALGSYIFGKLFVPYDITDPNYGKLREVKINGAFRIGYSVYTGIEYAFEKNFGINLGVKFTHANLLLKKSTAPTSDNSFDLNDDSSDPPVLYGGWKQFAYSSVFAGFTYYFGVKVKRYKLP
jgi:hypothetical protein